MGVASRLAQQGPLLHAELVLLVDDRQTDLLKANVVLNDRLSADYEIDLSLDNLFKYPVAFPGRQAADAIDRSVTGNVLDEPAPLIEPGVTEVPFACGPQAVE